jgi:hypothetical protein
MGCINAQQEIDGSCCPGTNSDQFCYIGTLDLKLKTTEAQQFNLFYDGIMVDVNDGVYCFKESKDVEKYYVLFMDPEAIRSIKKSTEGNTISHLAFTPQTTYHFYRFKRIPAHDNTYEWHIKRKPMPKIKVQNQLIAVIPDHTLIIPLDSQFFKKTASNSILFTYKALENNARVIKLPAPVASGKNKEELQDALLRAKLCMIHLKNIHAKQEMKEIYLDKHRLLQ